MSGRHTKRLLLCIDTYVFVTFYFEEDEHGRSFTEIEKVQLGPYDIFSELGETTLFDLTVQISEDWHGSR